MPTYTTAVSQMTTRRSFDLLFQTITNSSSGSITRAGKQTSITIYSGVQPTAQVIEADWTSYNQSAATCLAHYSTGPTWLWNNGTLTYYFTNTDNSITANAINSGTASWAIIWNGSAVNVNTEILPNSGRFIVVPVTLNSSNGISFPLMLPTLLELILNPFLMISGSKNANIAKPITTIIKAERCLIFPKTAILLMLIYLQFAKIQLSVK
jgi:hypothetical protein